MEKTMYLGGTTTYKQDIFFTNLSNDFCNQNKIQHNLINPGNKIWRKTI